MRDKVALARQIKAASQLTGDFLLRSGVRSSTYFDKYQFESDPALLKCICEQLAQIVPSGTQVLAGLELGGIPLAVVLGQLTNLPIAYVRKQAKEYGTCRLAEGPDMRSRQVLLVEDVVTSGGAIRDAAAALRAEGVSVSEVICVIERKGNGRQLLQGDGLNLMALFSQDDLERA